MDIHLKQITFWSEFSSSWLINFSLDTSVTTLMYFTDIELKPEVAVADSYSQHIL